MRSTWTRQADSTLSGIKKADNVSTVEKGSAMKEVRRTFCFFVRHPLQAPLIREGILMVERFLQERFAGGNWVQVLDIVVKDCGEGLG